MSVRAAGRPASDRRTWWLRRLYGRPSGAWRRLLHAAPSSPLSRQPRGGNAFEACARAGERVSDATRWALLARSIERAARRSLSLLRTVPQRATSDLRTACTAVITLLLCVMCVWIEEKAGRAASLTLSLSLPAPLFLCVCMALAIHPTAAVRHSSPRAIANSLLHSRPLVVRP